MSNCALLELVGLSNGIKGSSVWCKSDMHVGVTSPNIDPKSVNKKGLILYIQSV